ncbi:unnamed protein product [Durusdinium trenchii]
MAAPGFCTSMCDRLPPATGMSASSLARLTSPLPWHKSCQSRRTRISQAAMNAAFLFSTHLTEMSSTMGPAMCSMFSESKLLPRNILQKLLEMSWRLAKIFEHKDVAKIPNNVNNEAKLLACEARLKELLLASQEVEKHLENYRTSVLNFQRDIERRKDGYDSQAATFAAVMLAAFCCACPPLVGGSLVLEGAEVAVATVATGGMMLSQGAAQSCTELLEYLSERRGCIRECQTVISTLANDIAKKNESISNALEDMDFAQESEEDGNLKDLVEILNDIADDLDKLWLKAK